MVQVSKLQARDRLVLAELSGLAGRYGNGTERDAPRDQAVAAIREVTTDGWLLGIAAGAKMADPHGLGGPAVDLLRAAGADMGVAEQHAADTRTRLGRSGTGYRHAPA